MSNKSLLQLIAEEVIAYERLLDEDMSKDSQMRYRNRERNAEFIIAMLKHPRYSPDAYKELIKGYDVIFELRKNDLNAPSKRDKFAELMSSTANKILKLFFIEDDKKISHELYDSVARIVFSQKFAERQSEGKVILISLILFGDWSGNSLALPKAQQLKEKIEKIARFGSYKLCRDLSKRIVSTIGIYLGHEKKKSRAELMQIALEDLDATNDIDDYRTTLLILQKELNSLKEDNENELKNKVDAFVVNFFATMNSAKNSYLLDTITDINRQLLDSNSELHTNHVLCLKKLEILSIIFNNLLILYDIYPIHQIDEKMKIKMNLLSNYDIVSYKDIELVNLSSNSSEVQAQILAPGWKMNDLVVEKPKIKLI